MTHEGMRVKASPRVALALSGLLALVALTGCDTLHGWAQASSGHTPTAGASISLPLGK